MCVCKSLNLLLTLQALLNVWRQHVSMSSIWSSVKVTWIRDYGNQMLLLLLGGNKHTRRKTCWIKSRKWLFYIVSFAKLLEYLELSLLGKFKCISEGKNLQCASFFFACAEGALDTDWWKLSVAGRCWKIGREEGRRAVGIDPACHSLSGWLALPISPRCGGRIRCGRMCAPFMCGHYNRITLVNNKVLIRRFITEIHWHGCYAVGIVDKC